MAWTGGSWHKLAMGNNPRWGTYGTGIKGINAQPGSTT